MTTTLNLSLASVVSSWQMAIFEAGTFVEFQQAPISSVTWADDGSVGNDARWLGFGMHGGLFYTAGSAVFDMNSIAALASGQAIAWVGWQSIAGVSNGINAKIAGAHAWTRANTAGGSSKMEEAFTDGSHTRTSIAPPGDPTGDWRSYIDTLQIEFNCDPISAGQSEPVFRVGELRLNYQVHNRPVLSAIVPTTGGTVTTTTRPTIGWSFAGDGASQGAFRVRVFSAAQYGIGGFNPESSPSTYDSGISVSTNTSLTLPTNLANGVTYRAYVMAAQKLPVSNFQHWTTDGTSLAALPQANSYTEFTVDTSPPAAPTAMTPATGATLISDLAVLGAQIVPLTATGFRVKAEWQLATDAGFTTNLRTITQPDSQLGGVVGTSRWVYHTITAGASELFQGTWYLRARTIDEMGVPSAAYLATQTFTVTHPPTAGSLNPTGAASQSYTAGASSPHTFSWLFSDTSPTDTQTAFQLIIERDSDGLGLIDTGKTVSTASSSTQSILLAYKDVLLRWRVRLWDSDDVAGAYTANQQFYVRDMPVPTITDPTGGGTYTSPTPTITWDFAATSGRTQTNYRVTLTGDVSGLVVYDSGWLAGNDLSHAVATPSLVSMLDYTTAVSVRDSVGLEGTTTASATATWTPPTNPTFTLDASDFDRLGGVVLTWPENRDAAFIDYRVWRTVEGVRSLAGSDDSTVPTTYTFTDYEAPGNATVNYEVTQRAMRFGSLVEGATTVGLSDVTGSGHYWLIDLEEPLNNVRLRNVTADDFSEVWEQETIHLIGRGRRVERGTRYGYEGSLEATVYDDPENVLTARDIRLRLEALKAGSVSLRLRSPFGDVWRVAIGDLEMGRMAGVGGNEFFTVSVPYLEVAE